jgi:hypothetical protein
MISGIAPKRLIDYLFVTSGELKNKVVKTLKACDYEIVFMDKNGQEGNIIRFRPFGIEKLEREPEAICIMDDMTNEVLDGKLLVGLTPRDAKPINAPKFSNNSI